MSTLSQFVGGSPIKSIQRGVIGLGYLSASATATISTVNTSKTVLSFCGSSTNGSYGGIGLVRIALTNSTTVTATRDNIGSGESAIVSYEVVEYN